MYRPISSPFRSLLGWEILSTGGFLLQQLRRRSAVHGDNTRVVLGIEGLGQYLNGYVNLLDRGHERRLIGTRYETEGRDILATAYPDKTSDGQRKR